MKVFLNNTPLVFGKKNTTKVLSIGLNNYFCDVKSKGSVQVKAYNTYAISEVLLLRAGETISVVGVDARGVGAISKLDTAGELTSSSYTTALIDAVSGVYEYSYTATEDCRVVVCCASAMFTGNAVVATIE